MELVIPIASLIAATVIPWIIYRLGNPRRKLTYTITTTPLLAHAAASGRVTVATEWSELTQPHIVDFALQSDSRTDIDNRKFNGGNALEFDLGVKIHEVLQQGSTDVKVKVCDKSLRIEPQLIRKNDKSQLTLLVDGEPSEVTPSKTLTNVDIQQSKSIAPSKLSRRKRMLVPLMWGTYGALVVSIMNIFTSMMSPLDVVDMTLMHLILSVFFAFFLIAGVLYIRLGSHEPVTERSASQSS